MELSDLHKLLTCDNSKSREVIESLQKKYNCSAEKIYWNFRSVYGKKLREAREEYREPTRAEFERNVLLTSTKEELRNMYKHLSSSQWRGIYDRIFGVSTYSRAKEIALLSLAPTAYSPETDNNEAMWAAFRLGDGSFCKKRKAWKIEHCHWQKGWLERKVEMFVKAFPQASTKIVHNEKRNTYSWYSCKVGSPKFHEIGESPKHEIVDKLNLFGIWLLFLDDGCYYNKSQQVLNLAVENMEIATRLVEQIERLGGPTFRVANKNCIVLTTAEKVHRFMKMFLEPFAEITPECMKYKITYVPL